MRKKPLRSEYDPNYARMWRAVRAGIKDFRNAHPDEILPADGDREASLIKRIVGKLVSIKLADNGQVDTDRKLD